MHYRSYSHRPFPYARPAVTLLEIVLAMGILVFVSSMTYWFYSSSLETSEEGTAAAQKLRLMRVVLDRMATEIRQAAVITVDNRVGVRGEAERIWLSTYRVPRQEHSRTRMLLEMSSVTDEPPPAEYDLTKVEYRIVRHPEVLHQDGYEFPLGLARVETLIPRPDRVQTDEALEKDERDLEEESETEAKDEGDGEDELEDEVEEPLLGGELSEEEEERGDVSLEPEIEWDELYAPEIRYLRLCYYDGHRWWDTWEVAGESPLPQLVMVTIGFEPRPPFGEEFGLGEIAEINEEFCECLNEEPVDCEPLAQDQFSTVVRVPQSDPLFRSRVSRETQALVQELNAGEDEE